MSRSMRGTLRRRLTTAVMAGLSVSLLAPALASGTVASDVTLEAAASELPSGRDTFRTIDDYHAEIDALVEEYPDLVKPIELPYKTTSGRTVRGFEVTNDVHARDGKPVFANVAMHHGNEWASGELTMEFAIDVVQNADDPEMSALLDEVRMVVVPIVNPDGFVRDRRQTDTNTDMNRNYGFGWIDGSTAGEAAWSEPEARNIQWLLSTRQATVFNTQHTCIQVVLYPPLNNAAGPAQDTDRLHALASSVAAEYGPTYRALASADDYETNGEAIDWAYYATRGLAITTETCPAVRPRGHVWDTEVLETYPQHRNAMMHMLEAAADPEQHATIEGQAPVGSTLTISKSFDMWTRPFEQADGTVAPISFEQELESSMEVTSPDGTFEWAVNPSYRPVPAYQETGIEGPQTEFYTEPWTLTCEAPDGRTVSSEINVDLGQTVEAVLSDCGDLPPLTGFELTGGETWTTLEEEYAFLEQVDELSDRVTVTELTTTAQGRPLHLVQFGSEPRTAEEVSELPAYLTICLQHGNEPAAREGCLQTLRDLAFNPDPAIDEMLENTTIMFVPTVNPDGRAANTRANSNRIDINRDHLALQTEEAQALARLIRDYGVDSINDAHEYGPAREGYDYHMLYLWPRNLNVDNRVYDLARELNETYVVGAMEAAGYTSSVYGIRTTNPPVQVAGDEDERIFRNMAGLRHVAGMLTESVTSVLPGETPLSSRLRRVDVQVEGQKAGLEFFFDNAEELQRTTASAAFRAERQGQIGAGAVYVGGADNDPPERDQIIARNACSYNLTDEQYEEVAQTLELHGIEVTETADGVNVSMAQAARSVIVLMLDERARFNLVDGTPVSCRTR